MIDSEIDPFILNYRDSLERQRDLANQNMANERRLAQTQIMSMMYSNFPERAKIQYDTQTYLPNTIKVQQTYQTGLQKLRENTLNLANQLKSVNEAIAELNEA